MKRTLKITMFTLIALLGLLLLTLILAGGSLIKGLINKAGPRLLGVPVSVERVVFKPFQGKIGITALHVGNPSGFKTPSLVELGDVQVDLVPLSLFKETILIRQIIITAPELTYEKGLLRSNINTLLDQLGGGGKAGVENPGNTPPEPRPPAPRGKKVIIERLVVTDPKVRLSLTLAGGHALPIALGQVELKDIGKEGGGVSVGDALRILLSVITSNVENAILGTGQIVGDGAKAVGRGAMAAGSAVAGGAATAVKSLGALIGVGGKDQTNTPPSP